MKKQISAIAIASVFAITFLFAVAATHLDARNLGIGSFNVQASVDQKSLEDLRDVGSGQYGGQA